MPPISQTEYDVPPELSCEGMGLPVTHDRPQRATRTCASMDPRDPKDPDIKQKGSAAHGSYFLASFVRKCTESEASRNPETEMHGSPFSGEKSSKTSHQQGRRGPLRHSTRCNKDPSRRSTRHSEIRQNRHVVRRRPPEPHIVVSLSRRAHGTPEGTSREEVPLDREDRHPRESSLIRQHMKVEEPTPEEE